jgi:hypothetical protein
LCDAVEYVIRVAVSDGSRFWPKKEDDKRGSGTTHPFEFTNRLVIVTGVSPLPRTEGVIIGHG